MPIFDSFFGWFFVEATAAVSVFFAMAVCCLVGLRMQSYKKCSIGQGGCLFVAFAFGQSVVLDFQGFGRLDGLGCLLERGAGIDNVVNDEDAFALSVPCGMDGLSLFIRNVWLL